MINLMGWAFIIWRRRSTGGAIWEDVLRGFAQRPKIEFAYPTQRFYNRGVEKEQDTEGRRT